MGDIGQLQLKIQKKCIRLRVENDSLKEINHTLAFQNLKMRQELQVLAMHPGSTAAEKILHRYRLKASIMQDVKKSLLNENK